MQSQARPAFIKARRPDWIFDGSEIPDPTGHGQRAVDFIKSLRHPKSQLPDNAFELPLLWEWIIQRIYGPCDELGKRKTTMAAVPALNHTFG